MNPGYPRGHGGHQIKSRGKNIIAFLIDADNFSAPAWIDEAFQTLERSGGAIAIRRAYGSAENLKGLTDTRRVWDIRPFVNLSLPKDTTDMSLAVDAMALACSAHSPKVIVIGSGDLDFVPLVVRQMVRAPDVAACANRPCAREHTARRLCRVWFARWACCRADFCKF